MKRAIGASATFVGMLILSGCSNHCDYGLYQLRETLLYPTGVV